MSERWDAFICAVDNGETRRVLDDVNAKVLVNAGLGSHRYDAGFLLWSQHGKVGKRLSELYAVEPPSSDEEVESVPEEFEEKCSRLNYREVSLSMPFVALAASSLLIASLFHSDRRGLKPSLVQIDLFGRQQKILLEQTRITEALALT
ncbi:MAG: hypothetical protein ACK419_06715 [Pyrinomonadaceae bacterium]